MTLKDYILETLNEARFDFDAIKKEFDSAELCNLCAELRKEAKANHKSNPDEDHQFCNPRKVKKFYDLFLANMQAADMTDTIPANKVDKLYKDGLIAIASIQPKKGLDGIYEFNIFWKDGNAKPDQVFGQIGDPRAKKMSNKSYFIASWASPGYFALSSSAALKLYGAGAGGNSYIISAKDAKDFAESCDKIS